jgi:hypothetical protein
METNYNKDICTLCGSGISKYEVDQHWIRMCETVGCRSLAIEHKDGKIYRLIPEPITPISGYVWKTHNKPKVEKIDFKYELGDIMYETHHEDPDGITVESAFDVFIAFLKTCGYADQSIKDELRERGKE